MDTADKDERIDDDILQSRADVLRASGMTPAGKEQMRKQSEPEGGSEDTAPPADSVEGTPENEAPANSEDAPIQAEPTGSVEEAAEAKGAPAEKSEIPRFDLSEDIMAEQRRITAVRRKRPGETKVSESSGTGVEGVSEAFGHVAPAKPEQDESIADLVARDIERLLRGERADF